MMTHAFINVVIPFADDKSDAVNERLRTLVGKGNRPNDDIVNRMERIGTVHFMSITVVKPKCPAEDDVLPDPAAPPRSETAHLLIEISADGGAAETLTRVAAALESELTQIFAAAGIEPDDLGAYLLEQNRVIGAEWGSDAVGQVFTGSPGQTVRRIRGEEGLARDIGVMIEKFRRELKDWHWMSARQRLDHVRNELWKRGDAKWAFVPEPAPCLAGDPLNKWNPDTAISNPQLRRAGLWVFRTLLWPLYMPLALFVLAVLAFTVHSEGAIVSSLLTTSKIVALFGLVVVLIVFSKTAYSWLRPLLIGMAVLGFVYWKYGPGELTPTAIAISGLVVVPVVARAYVFAPGYRWLRVAAAGLAMLAVLWLAADWTLPAMVAVLLSLVAVLIALSRTALWWLRPLLILLAILAFTTWKRGPDFRLTWTAVTIIGSLGGLIVTLAYVFGPGERWFRIAAAALTLVVLLGVAYLTWPVSVGLGLIVGFLVALATVILLAYRRLIRLESSDPVEDLTPPKERVERLMSVENFSAQNHLASVSRLKPGPLRRLTLRLAFIGVGTAGFFYAPGFLGTNGVIHFARWMRLPGTEQLLFWSNFDGTWDSYVADFIADAPTGVTAIWSNCVGFPKTKRLTAGGAEERDRLVRWARRQQSPTFWWYSAYPNLTTARIRINAAIRQGLASAESDADARDWLALFGSAPRPPEALETTRIPTLVFGGLSRLPYAACHAITFYPGKKEIGTNERRICQQWLAKAAKVASYGEVPPGQKFAVVIAFSAQGLAKCGVPDEAIKTFPVAFQQGMWPKWRSRALGDTGYNVPKDWLWGSQEKPVDLLLLVYGQRRDEEHDDLEDAQRELIQEAKQRGRVESLSLTPLDQTGEFQREPFGFVDGVSQPVIRGLPRSKWHHNSNDLVAPGEIVLGYPDNISKIPPSPSIAVKYDPDHFLPDAGPDPMRRRPEFSRYEAKGRRDLGANGTFLVVRQLEQNTEALDVWLNAAIDEVNDHLLVAVDRKRGRRMILWGSNIEEGVESPLPRPRRHAFETLDPTNDADRGLIKDIIAAKLVGRWKDGTSLVNHPRGPGAEQNPPEKPDNDFLLGSEDPSGLACPFGAHIRRANPRDTRFPGSAEEIAATNRHRILRVGRKYGSNDAGERGLLFMCMNADIERQFEFIQKTWLLNPNIHGLENEVDPLMGEGDGSESSRMTIPTVTGSIQLTRLPQFVTVRAGGYFFLPGRNVLQFLAQWRNTPDQQAHYASEGDAVRQ